MTAGRRTLSIVIPAFNEAGRIEGSLEQLTAFLDTQPWDYDIRVVDDGSTDGTADVVTKCASHLPRIVLQRESHRGKGGAVKAGLLAAAGEFRFMCDADLSMPPAEILRFLPPQQADCDVGIGSREGLGARRVGEPWRRHVIGRVLNRAIQSLAIPGIADTQCGFKMFTAESVAAIFPHVTLDGWAFDVEVLCIARAKGLRIAQIPIEWHHRPESKVSVLRDSWGMLRDVLRVRARVRRGSILD